MRRALIVLAAILSMGQITVQDVTVRDILFGEGVSGFQDPTSSRYFDRDSDRVAVSDAGEDWVLDLSLATNGHTLCAWVKPDGSGHSGTGRIIDKGGSQTRGDGHSFGLNDGTDKEFDVWIDADATGDYTAQSNTAAWAIGTWNCLCVTVNNSTDTATFWKDGSDHGAQDSAIDLGPPEDNSRAFYIGMRHDGYREFDGRMAYIQVWDEPIGTASIISNACYKPGCESQDLVGYWRLTDVGTTQKDYSTNDNHGTASGTTLITNDGPPITDLCNPGND